METFELGSAFGPQGLAKAVDGQESNSPDSPAPKRRKKIRRAKKKPKAQKLKTAPELLVDPEQFGRPDGEEKPVKEDLRETFPEKPATLQDIEIELRAVSQSWEVPREVQPAVIATLVKTMTGGSRETVKLKAAIALKQLVDSREKSLMQQAMLHLRKRVLGIEDEQQSVVLEGSAVDSSESIRSLIRGCETKEELTVVKAMLIRQGLLDDE